MKGLSEEIELSIQNALVGMELNVDLKVDDDKLSTLVKSRIDSFLLLKNFWSLAKFSNAPSHEKLKTT
jgi:hypothetical protein